MKFLNEFIFDKIIESDHTENQFIVRFPEIEKLRKGE